MRTFAALLLAAVTLAACSSAPAAPPGVQDRKNRAADYLKFGRQAFQEAQFDQALTFYRMALDLDTAVDHVAGMAAAWNSVAMAQTALGQNLEARGSLAQAEAFAGLSGDRTLVLQVAVNLVQAAIDSKDFEGARQRLTALAPFPSTAEGAALDHALGTLEKDLDHPAEALAAFDRALAVNQRLDLKQEMASNRFMKAAVYGRQGRWAEARLELQAALVLDRTMENTLGIGQDWRSLGSVALKLGETQAAYEAFLRATQVFQAAGLEDQRVQTVRLLVTTAEALGLSDEAAQYRATLPRTSNAPR